MAVTVDFLRKITKLLLVRNSFLFLFLFISPSFLFANSDIVVASFEWELEQEALESRSSGIKTDIVDSVNFTSVTKQTFITTEAKWEDKEQDFLLNMIVLQKQVLRDFQREMVGFKSTYSINPLRLLKTNPI